MKRDSCIRELNQILNLAERCNYLWSKNPKLKVEFYSSLPEPDESARISLMKNGRFGFNLGGTYFNLYINTKKEDLSPEETWSLASRLLENMALREGDLINYFRLAMKKPVGGYFASRVLGL